MASHPHRCSSERPRSRRATPAALIGKCASEAPWALAAEIFLLICRLGARFRRVVAVLQIIGHP
eukprot:7160198-Pyramimonas_sp.AAC.1